MFWVDVLSDYFPYEIIFRPVGGGVIKLTLDPVSFVSKPVLFNTLMSKQYINSMFGNK